MNCRYLLPLFFVASILLSGRSAYGGPPWDARVGLTVEQLQTRTNAFKARGYQVVETNGYVVGGNVRHCAIWEKKGGPAWDARVGLTVEQLQIRTNTFKSRGYQVVETNAYVVGKDVRYCAIWEKKDGPAWDARVGLTADQLQLRTNALLAQGYRVVETSGYVVGGSVRYCAIWEKRGGPAWDARIGLTLEQLQTRTNAFKAQGYQVVEVNGYVVGKDVRYCAIWEKKGGPAWDARVGLTVEQLQVRTNALKAQGYRVVETNGYVVDGNVRYCAIWEKE